MRTPRDLGRRPAKARQKMRTEKRRAGESYQFEEQHVPTSEEVVERTLNSLRRLGTQKFAVAPFYDHFDRWLLSLRTVVSEFQSSPAVHVDEQFQKECSQVLSDIERALKDRRLKEASREEQIRSLSQKLSETRSLLTQAERDYTAKVKEISGRREHAAKPIAASLGRLREELDRIVRMRTGFLRGISKKAKAEKAAEATQRLDSKKRELSNIERSFAAQEEKLRDEYKRQKKQILEQIAGHQKELTSLEADSEIDDAANIRGLACDALVNTINELLRRIETAPEDASPST